MQRPEVYAARKLRRQMSLPEVLIWQRLRRDATGVRIRHQHPIGAYKADFYCAKARLVIEIDGEGHNRGDQPTRDVERDRFMSENGYQVIRIAAADVLRDPDAVAASIAALVASPLHHPAVPGGPPPRGVPTKVVLSWAPRAGEEQQ